MTPTLVVTNDFPPRQGGIQSFVHELARRQPRRLGRRLRLRPRGRGARSTPQQPFPVVRHPTGLLVPTPAARRRTVAALREHGATAVWFGASAPLGPARPGAAPRRRASGSSRPRTGTRSAGRCCPAPGRRCAAIGDGCDVVTYLGEYTRRRHGAARSGRHPTLRAAHTWGRRRDLPARTSTAPRSAPRYGLAGRPVVVCVSRLVPRKGQDLLIEALPAVRRAVPDAALLLVGRGPYDDDLRALRRAARRRRRTWCSPAGCRTRELPAHYAAGDVFAMPCRTRRARAGRRGPRHRLPRGVGDRAAGGRRRLRRRARRGARRRDRLRRRRPRRAARSPTRLVEPARRRGAARAAGRGRPRVGRARLALGRAGRPH